MRRLAAVERALERLFERPSAKLFRLRLQPVQVLRRVERAMEGERRMAGGRTVVPERLEVHLNPKDLEAFEGVAGEVAAELADGALAFARAHGYAVGDRPRVTLRADPAIESGEVRVAAEFGDRGSGDGADVDGSTRVYEAPQLHAPAAILQVRAPDGTTRRVPVDGRRLSIGRGPDNGLEVRDGRVSRHHARINVRHRALVFTDLDSMNGSRVNGVRVSEVALGEGDRIEVGETVIVVEALAPEQVDEPAEDAAATARPDDAVAPPPLEGSA
jgi:hypothetical protein